MDYSTTSNTTLGNNVIHALSNTALLYSMSIVIWNTKPKAWWCHTIEIVGNYLILLKENLVKL